MFRKKNLDILIIRSDIVLPIIASIIAVYGIVNVTHFLSELFLFYLFPDSIRITYTDPEPAATFYQAIVQAREETWVTMVRRRISSIIFSILFGPLFCAFVDYSDQIWSDEWFMSAEERMEYIKQERYKDWKRFYYDPPYNPGKQEID